MDHDEVTEKDSPRKRKTIEHWLTKYPPPFCLALHFFIDFERDKACNLHVAQTPLTKGVLFAPATRMLLATLRNPAAGRQATTNLDSQKKNNECS
jgi:hypothetical protein